MPCSPSRTAKRPPAAGQRSSSTTATSLPDEYRTTERYIAYVDSLARHGYIVFRIDYRGHDRSEGPASGAYGDPGYTVDVLNAGWLQSSSSPRRTRARIGMWGQSTGGFLTLRAMVASPDVAPG